MREMMNIAQSGIDAPLAEALADELVALTGRLASLAFDLGSDTDILRRHMATLQSVDLITQTQIAIADVLRSDEPVDARIAAITLEDLADRLRDRIA